jgi:hypothetical protein
LPKQCPSRYIPYEHFRNALSSFCFSHCACTSIFAISVWHNAQSKQQFYDDKEKNHGNTFLGEK